MSHTVCTKLSFGTAPGRVRPNTMMFYALLAYTSALLSSGLVIFVLCARRRTIVHWSFAAGMSTIALMEMFMGLRVQAIQPAEAVYWKFLSYLAAAFLPGSWLLFSLS